MVESIGTDIIEMRRIAEFVGNGERHVRRVFTSAEVAEARGRGGGVEYFAGRFAAKEAVAKALGPPLGWHEVEVLAGSSGCPEVRLRGRASEKCGGRRVLLSISHCREYATAVAVVVGG